MRQLNIKLCSFYGHPGKTGSAYAFADQALDYILSCDTRLVIVDDVHFLNMRNKDGLAIVNHFKSKGSCPASGVDADQANVRQGVGVAEFEAQMPPQRQQRLHAQFAQADDQRVDHADRRITRRRRRRPRQRLLRPRPRACPRRWLRQ